MIISDAPAHSLGETDLRRMKREGWRFTPNAVRVANGWAMLVLDPHGHYQMVVVADPDDEPEKFHGDGVSAPDDRDQLDLFSPNIGGETRA